MASLAPAPIFPRVLLAGFTVAFVAIWLAPPHHALEDLARYLPLHTFVEVVSIAVAALVFGVVWNAYSEERSDLVVLGCALFAAALIDFAHVLSYAGMPDFVTPSGAQKSIFFWLAARTVAAAGLLAAAFWPHRPLAAARSRYAGLALALGVAALVYWIGLFHQSVLPRMFVQGSGLTPMKRLAELFIIALLAGAAVLFYRRRTAEGAALCAASLLSILSELCFTLYSALTDIFTLLGHVYKIAAYAFLYRAVFVTSVRAPFLAATDRAAKLARAERIAHVGSWEVDLPANRMVYSEEALRIHGLEPGQFEGTLNAAIGFAHPEDRVRLTAAINATLYEGKPFSIDYRIVRADGEVRHVHAEDEVLRTRAGAPVRAFGITQDITERKLGQLALEESEERYRLLMSTMAEGMLLIGADGRCLACNESAARIMRCGTADLLERSSQDLHVELVREDGTPYGFDETPAMAALRTGAAQQEQVVGLRFADGAVVWTAGASRPLFRPGEDQPYATVSTFHDETERKAQRDRIERLTRVYAMLSGINGTIVRVRERRELFDEACRIAVEAGRFRMAWIGLVEGDAVHPVSSAGDVRDFFERAPLAVVETRPGGHGLAGRAVREMKPMVSNDVQNDPQRLMKAECLERGIRSLAVLPLLLEGKAIGILAFYAADAGFFDEDEMRLLQELAGDLSFALDHLQKAEKLQYLAYYDALTGLANRTLFVERLALEIGAAARDGQRLALVIVDIERFKRINDTFGRQVGDGLLRQIGSRLVELTGDASRVARLAADQFAIAVPRVRSDDGLMRRLEEGNRRIDGDPYTVEGHELRIATRAGAALFPSDGADAETLLRNAEAALKKAAAGEAFIFYTPAMTERVGERLALENKLRKALEREEFVLYYQPKVDLATRRVVGMEALIRWRSPERGLVPPMEFIPLLEETGLILPVGAWALRRAALDHRAWAEKGLEPGRVAVNVSAIQLRRGDFVRALQQAIAAGAAPAGIDLEITESAVMEEMDANIAKLHAVRELGVRVTLDDFGTGYSSLGYLAKLPVQALKIDRSFVSAMAEGADAANLVSTIVSLGHSLRLSVVAEGIETELQARVLQAMRCDEAQGYLFGRPMPAEELEARLEVARVGGAAA